MGDSPSSDPLLPGAPSSTPRWFARRRRMLLLALACVLGGTFLSSLFAPAHPVDSAPANIAAAPVDEYKKGTHPPSVWSDLSHAVGNHLPTWSHANLSLPAWTPWNSSPSYPPRNSSISSPGKGGIDPSASGEQEIDPPNMRGARTRIGKVSMLFGVDDGVWERCLRTHERHNIRHGYRTNVLRQPLLDDVWGKPAYILELLLRELAKPPAERLEWLFWADADSVVVNPLIPIETFLPPSPEFDDVHLVYVNDFNGLNNGVFPLRVHPWSVELFAAVVAFRHYRPDEHLVTRDQAALEKVLADESFVGPHAVEAPQRWFNAYAGEHNATLEPYSVRRGDLLVHFAGVPNRESVMQHWLERAEAALPDWELPVPSTSYPDEARDFWQRVREARADDAAALDAARARATHMHARLSAAIADYGPRLSHDQRESLDTALDALHATIVTAPDDQNATAIVAAADALAAVRPPLAAARAAALADISRAAHAAVFAAVKALLDRGHDAPVALATAPTDLPVPAARLYSAVLALKRALVAPEDDWAPTDMRAATEEVAAAVAALPPLPDRGHDGGGGDGYDGHDGGDGGDGSDDDEGGTDGAATSLADTSSADTSPDMSPDTSSHAPDTAENRD